MHNPMSGTESRLDMQSCEDGPQGEQTYQSQVQETQPSSGSTLKKGSGIAKKLLASKRGGRTGVDPKRSHTRSSNSSQASDVHGKGSMMINQVARMALDEPFSSKQSPNFPFENIAEDDDDEVDSGTQEPMSTTDNEPSMYAAEDAFANPRPESEPVSGIDNEVNTEAKGPVSTTDSGTDIQHHGDDLVNTQTGQEMQKLMSGSESGPDTQPYKDGPQAEQTYSETQETQSTSGSTLKKGIPIAKQIFASKRGGGTRVDPNRSRISNSSQASQSQDKSSNMHVKGLMMKDQVARMTPYEQFSAKQSPNLPFEDDDDDEETALPGDEVDADIQEQPMSPTENEDEIYSAEVAFVTPQSESSMMQVAQSSFNPTSIDENRVIKQVVGLGRGRGTATRPTRPRNRSSNPSHASQSKNIRSNLHEEASMLKDQVPQLAFDEQFLSTQPPIPPFENVAQDNDEDEDVAEDNVEDEDVAALGDYMERSTLDSTLIDENRITKQVLGVHRGQRTRVAPTRQYMKSGDASHASQTYSNMHEEVRMLKDEVMMLKEVVARLAPDEQLALKRPAIPSSENIAAIGDDEDGAAM